LSNGEGFSEWASADVLAGHLAKQLALERKKCDEVSKTRHDRVGVVLDMS